MAHPQFGVIFTFHTRICEYKSLTIAFIFKNNFRLLCLYFLNNYRFQCLYPLPSDRLL